MNTAQKIPQTPIADVSILSLVQTPESLHQENVMCQAILQIREMLNSKKRNPAYIFDNVLNTKQREMLCFSAGLKRADLTKQFNELSEDARVNIKKSIMLCGNIFSTFNKANALESKKFIKVEQ